MGIFYVDWLFYGKNDDLAISSNESFRWILIEGDFLRDRALDFKDNE